MKRIVDRFQFVLRRSTGNRRITALFCIYVLMEDVLRCGFRLGLREVARVHGPSRGQDNCACMR